MLIESISDFGDDLSDMATLDSSEIYLYVASSLAIFDKETSMPTFELNGVNLGLDSAKIAWEKHI